MNVGGVAHANLALRFLLELAALAALAYWGFHTGTSLAGDLLLGMGAPLVAALVWATWAAPRSTRRLTGGRLTAVQVLVLGAGAAALIAAGHAVLGTVLAVVIAANAVALEHTTRRRDAAEGEQGRRTPLPGHPLSARSGSAGPTPPAGAGAG